MINKKIKSYGVYLIGPMEEVSIKEMTGWRETASTALGYQDIPVYDPTRRLSLRYQLEDYLDNEKMTVNLYKRIFKQDLQDIHNSSVVLADCRRNKGAIRRTGSDMEMMFAHVHNKIIIAWCDEKDTLHPFYESIITEKHFSLDSAIEAAAEYFT